MKTILVLTDFSINADYVALYALELAKKVEANLLICNIYDAPADEIDLDLNSWPLPTCKRNSINDLEVVVARLKTKLNKDDDGRAYRPEIEQCSIAGFVAEHLRDMASKHNILLAIISVHSRTSVSGLFKKDHAWDIIDHAGFPVMVIPYQIKFKPFNLIAFATVLHNTDVAVLGSVSALAKYTDAGILITHVSVKQKKEDSIKHFFSQLPFKITYPKLLYYNIKGSDVVKSLKELCTYVDIDLLVVIHRKRSFFQNLFGNGVARKMAVHPNKPLLVFPFPIGTEQLIQL